MCENNMKEPFPKGSIFIKHSLLLAKTRCWDFYAIWKMDIRIQEKLEKDFESYMFSFYNEFKRFALEDFGTFATTLLNYYINNNTLELKSKADAAYYMCTLYNKGIGNRITEEHLQIIAKAIVEDYSIDFVVAQRLF